MRVIVRSAAARDPGSLAASHDEPCLLRPETNRWEEFSTNLVALIGAVFEQRPGKEDAGFFAIATQRKWDPRDSMTASLMCHAAVVLLLINLTALLHFVGPDEPKKPRLQNQRLEWYKMTAELPSISPAAEEAKPQESGGKPPEKAREGATVLHPQTVVSNPANPDNNQQTIYQPDAPNVRITQTQALPNVVIWNDVARPAPPTDLVSRQLNALKMPVDLVRRSAVEEPPLAKLELPTAPAPAAKLPDAAMPTAPDVPMPPPPEAVASGANNDADGRLKKLVVMNANPAPPGGPIDVPEGNRAGAFSAGPNGRPGTPNGSPAANAGGGSGGPAPAGDGTLGGKRDLAGIRVPGLSVSGGSNGPVTGPVVSGPASVPAPAAAPLPSAPSRAPLDLRTSLAKGAPRPQLPDVNAPKYEPGFTPGKRVYTVLINMPNLSSGGGGSWVLRFAELELRAPVDQIEISAPVATRKIDPGYSPDAVREKVQGNVKLHAIIRRDGRVERVEVLHSLDSRLDQRAVDALLRWEFQPALRKGLPVDLEAVIEIPFKLPVVYK